MLFSVLILNLIHQQKYWDLKPKMSLWKWDHSQIHKYEPRKRVKSKQWQISLLGLKEHCFNVIWSPVAYQCFRYSNTYLIYSHPHWLLFFQRQVFSTSLNEVNIRIYHIWVVVIHLPQRGIWLITHFIWKCLRRTTILMRVQTIKEDIQFVKHDRFYSLWILNVYITVSTQLKRYSYLTTLQT